MFNKCALNALFGGPGRMRKVKFDNRNEEKGHFLCPALGTDVITCSLSPCLYSARFNRGPRKPKTAELRQISRNTEAVRYALREAHADSTSPPPPIRASIITPAVTPAVCWVNIQLGGSVNKLSQGGGGLRQEIL